MRYRWLPLLLFALMFAIPALAGTDPTRPETYAASPPAVSKARPALTLSAILLAPARHLAVINGVPRATGEHFDGQVLEQIAPNSVRVRDRWGVRILHLSPQTIKTPVRQLPARETDG